MTVKKHDDYYVYVYIDPRNNEEFYYGKGKGSRKDAHLHDTGDSSKAKRITAIRKAGLNPVIRVIARGLSESEALLVEKTLLWKLGKWTDNVASGHFADKFRPQDMLHLELPGFDFQRGLYFYNIGEGPHRNWDDYLKYGFISAGGGTQWKNAMLGFNVGDAFVAYLKRHGFVGVGKIISKAKMIREVRIDGKPLLSLPLKCAGMSERADSEENSEYVCVVSWIKTFPRTQAKWKRKSGLYTPELVRAVLRHVRTIEFVESEFDLEFKEILR